MARYISQPNSGNYELAKVQSEAAVHSVPGAAENNQKPKLNKWLFQ